MDKSIFITTDLVLDEQMAEAGISGNPYIRVGKFVLTDDGFNANKRRILQDEFDNLIRTGVNMPVKMASGAIADDHNKASPIGVITHLRKEENKIIGLTALWETERKEDVAYLKERAASDNPPQQSWEILYDNETETEGGFDLHGCVLKAATIVGLPAYKGRTPMYAVASEERNMELEERVKELEAELKKAQDALEEKNKATSTLETEAASLREYKTLVEAEKAKVEKLASIKSLFASAGIAKDESYFSTNYERFSKLEQNDLEFIVQEMASFKPKEETSSVKTPAIPAVVAEPTKNTAQEIIEGLRKFKG
jgi:Tfp pilus assembly protein FimV